MRRRRTFQVAIALVGLCTAWLLLARGLSAQLGPGVLYLAVVPPSSEQSSVRVDTSTIPNRVDIGCESFRLGGATVNCLRITGGSTGNPAVIAPLPAQGGDASPRVALGSGVSGFQSAFGGTCSVSAPNALTPFATARGQTPCTMPAGVTGSTQVQVMAVGADTSNFGTVAGLERGLVLKAALPQVVGNQIVLLFSCASSSACPATTAQSYVWWAINP